MTDSELHWLAGWLEGEGSFMKPSPSKPNQPSISAVCTDRDVIERVGRLLGSKVHEVNKTKCKVKGWKQQYQTRVRGIKARTFMMLLTPLMGERRQMQIRDALKASSDLRPAIKLTSEHKAMICTLLQQGHRTTDLAKRFNVSPARISQLNSSHRTV